MYQVIIVIHVLLGLGIIGLILIQQGKGADAGAAFGTGSSGSVFGAQGAASFLSRTTAILAALFFTTSLGLAVLNGKSGTSGDLITSTSTEQEAQDIPQVEVAKPVETLPAVVPEAKSEKIIAPTTATEQPVQATQAPIPAAVPVQPPVVTPAPAPEKVEVTKLIEVPKAEESKPIEKKKKAAAKKKQTEKDNKKK